MDSRVSRLAVVRPVFWVGASCLLAAGCGHSPDLPPMQKVTGKVTLDGQTVTSGKVQFLPEQATEGKSPVASGDIKEDGTYELFTAGEPGAAVGWHKVRVFGHQETDYEKAGDQFTIPIVYNYPEKSNLRKEVKAGDDNTIDLELKRNP